MVIIIRWGFLPSDNLSAVPWGGWGGCFGGLDRLVRRNFGDSFGFGTIEALASGMPVIASENAGAPVPDPNWRVPPHDAAAIQRKLLRYHTDRDMLCRDANVAGEFGQGFRPEYYRERAKKIFSEFLTA